MNWKIYSYNKGETLTKEKNLKRIFSPLLSKLLEISIFMNLEERKEKSNPILMKI